MDTPTRGVLTVARSVLEKLDLEVVLERVLASARDMTGARYAALGVLDDAQSGLSRFLTLGIDETARGLIGPLPTGRGVLGELMRNPEPLRLADVGSHPHSYGFPAGHPPMRSFLGVPIVIDGRPFGNLYLTEKADGSEFSEADEQAVMLLAEFAAVAIDHARRFAGSEAQRIELEHTVSALDATIQIARALGGQTNLQTILELVAKRARALVSARVVVIELLHGDQLELSAGAGEVPHELIGNRFGLEGTVASAALRSRKSQRLTDHLNRARFDQSGGGLLGLTAEDGFVVPLVFRDRAYGVVVALDHLGADEFTAEDQRLLEAFAVSAAAAVATAQLAADERRRQRLAATEAERSRWARELHDDTLQALGNLRLILAGASRNGDQAAMELAIRQSLEQLEQDITTLRALITELRPAALDQLGLGPALLALVDRVSSAELEIDAHVDLDYEEGRAEARLASELETGIYRIVQEALTNATKHGGATRASVEVLEDEHGVHMTIRDNGAGFDSSASTTGFGLLGMHERAELLAGTIAIESAPGHGTTINASIPVGRHDETPGVATASRRETG